MGQNVIKEKSYAFAIQIVKLCKYLQEEKKEYVLSKQLLRSGTAPGALVREAEQAESKKDFTHKMSIALKEANESDYWLSVMKETGYIPDKEFAKVNTLCIEIMKILTSIIKSSKN